MLARRGPRLAFAACVAGAGAALPFLTAPAALAAPADQVRDSQQWVLSMLDVPAAWMNASGQGVTVAVIDSGVNPDVSDLTGQVITGPDLTGLSTPSSNPRWGEHGTWMASIIAGHGHDGGDSGIMGVAPDAKILSIRVIPDKDDPGYAKYDSEPEQTIQDSLAAGIRTAVKDGARVISMSIGYSAPSGAVRAAVEYAYQHDVVLVASSGNSGLDERRDHGFAPVSFPAEYPGVIGVGALYRNGTAANFSSNNLSVRVAAPGQGVPAQGRDGLYWTVDGTSPACALVAGVAALIESRYPTITPGQVTETLTATASNGSGGYNPRTGFGTVDAGAALNAAGKLLAVHQAASPVPASAHFGGGPAAVPAAPVPPRGAGDLALYSVLAVLTLALALAAAARLRVLSRPRPANAGRRASRAPAGDHRLGYGPRPGPAGHPGNGYPGNGYPGAGYPSTGYTVPGSDYGGADEHA